VAFGSTPGAPAIILLDMRATRRKATVTLAFTGLEGGGNYHTPLGREPLPRRSDKAAARPFQGWVKR